MPGITFKVTGVKGLAQAMSVVSQKLSTGELLQKTITPIAIETKQRLEQDTPVVTGRLLRSTVLRRDAMSQTLGQSAPYANIVNNRRGYWVPAIQLAGKWPPFYIKTVQDELNIISRQFAGK
jgi:hypothetical protein